LEDIVSERKTGDDKEELLEKYSKLNEKLKEAEGRDPEKKEPKNLKLNIVRTISDSLP